MTVFNWQYFQQTQFKKNKKKVLKILIIMQTLQAVYVIKQVNYATLLKYKI